MKYSTLLTLAIPALVSALPNADPTPQRKNQKPMRLTGYVDPDAGGTVIDYLPIQASNTRFWVNKEPNISCPENSAAHSACQNTQYNQTQFAYRRGQPTISLDCMVPGGQEVYVNTETGRLRFTPAHSAQKEGKPKVKGFSVGDRRAFKFEGQDWLACGGEEKGIWAASRKKDGNEEKGEPCFAFTWRMNEVKDYPSPWQYN